MKFDILFYITSLRLVSEFRRMADYLDFPNLQFLNVHLDGDEVNHLILDNFSSSLNFDLRLSADLRLLESGSKTPIRKLKVHPTINFESDDFPKEVKYQSGSIKEDPYFSQLPKTLANMIRVRDEKSLLEFLNGDCDIQPGWVVSAMEAVATHPESRGKIGDILLKHPKIKEIISSVLISGKSNTATTHEILKRIPSHYNIGLILEEWVKDGKYGLSLELLKSKGVLDSESKRKVKEILILAKKSDDCEIEKLAGFLQLKRKFILSKCLECKLFEPSLISLGCGHLCYCKICYDLKEKETLSDTLEHRSMRCPKCKSVSEGFLKIKFS